MIPRYVCMRPMDDHPQITLHIPTADSAAGR